MQSKDELHFEGKGYGYKRRKKRTYILFEPKGKPDPVKFYFFAMLFLLIGVLASLHDQHRTEELRFINPITINVKLVGATCYGPSGKQRPHMFKTYVYSPETAGIYQTYDSIEYATKSDCDADLPNANAIFPRTHVWYDQNAPWDARWTLDEPSPVRVFSYFSVVSGLLLLIGLLEQRRLKRYRCNTCIG